MKIGREIVENYRMILFLLQPCGDTVAEAFEATSLSVNLWEALRNSKCESFHTML